MAKPGRNTIEIRAFGRLSALFKKKVRRDPLLLEVKGPITGNELAGKLEIPCEEIEVLIVNGVTQSLGYTIKPGDRVAFVPWGTPGPYRIFLGFIFKNKR